MTSLALKARLQRASAGRCEVPDCGRSRRNFSSLCRHHDQVRDRTGHPLGTTVRKRDVKPYLKLTSRWLKEHRNHPAIEAGCRWLDALVYGNRPHVTSVNPRSSPEDRLLRWLDRMKEEEVDPVSVLATIAAMFMLRECEPRTFRHDRHFHHQVTIRVLRLTRGPRREWWACGRQGFSYDRVTTGVREHLWNTLRPPIGALCLRIARAVTAAYTPPPPPPSTLLDGIRTPFPNE